jgi:hypothetical protein
VSFSTPPPKKDSCFESLIPNAMFTGGALEKLLNYEDADLVNSLIHSWVHN